MKVQIGLKPHRGVYPVKVWDNNGLLIRKRDDVKKEEISAFIAKKFEEEERNFLKKAIQLFRPPSITIKDRVIPWWLT